MSDNSAEARERSTSGVALELRERRAEAAALWEDILKLMAAMEQARDDCCRRCALLCTLRLLFVRACSSALLFFC